MIDAREELMLLEDPSWSGGGYSEPYIAEETNTATYEPAVLPVPTAAPAPSTTQRSCSSCGGGSSSTTATRTTYGTPGGGGELAALTDTRIDAGITIGWRELLVLLLAIMAARYFELI